MKVYLAARYSRREELCGNADDLRALGHESTARWLFGNHQLTDAQLSTEGTAEQRQRFAMEDWADLMAAELCVSFTEEPRSSNSRGGRHVEYGAALATGIGCIVVGPAENVFHCLPALTRFETWPEALALIKDPVALNTMLAGGFQYRQHYCAVCHEPLNHMHVFEGSDDSVLCPAHLKTVA